MSEPIIKKRIANYSTYGFYNCVETTFGQETCNVISQFQFFTIFYVILKSCDWSICVPYYISRDIKVIRLANMYFVQIFT